MGIWLVEKLGDVLPLCVLGLRTSNSLVLARIANPLRVSDSSVLHCEIASSGTR